MSTFPHLEGDEFADSPDNRHRNIDVLIGSDFYWSIILDGIRQGEKGPVAVNSKLGWILSGPSCVTSSGNETVSNLIVTEGEPELSEVVANNRLHLALIKRFWDTEAIGIEGELKTKDITLDPEFLKNIQYRNSHYEVSLPWRRDCSDIADHYNLCSNRLRYLQQRLLKKPEILKEYDKTLRNNCIRVLLSL